MDISPTESVCGMTTLDRSRFSKMISVPSVKISSSDVAQGLKVLKKYFLKLEKLKPVRESENDTRCLLLDPTLFRSYQQLDAAEKDKLKQLSIADDHFTDTTVELSYENFRIEDVFKAVLPEGKEGCTSYSRIGHIVHLNLRDHLLPFKQLIGEVLVDKLHGIRTVVNKNHIIDSTYRNFQMEVLAGDSDFVAEVKENQCTFKFDFSKVYWNPRLCTEHERIVKLLPERAVLFDVFAGVGPFAVPAAKIRKCRVFANDLNPQSYHWLKENVGINKVQTVETFNKDGREFIGKELRQFLSAAPNDSIHVTMNLPALAVEFLDAFPGLLAGEPKRKEEAQDDKLRPVDEPREEDRALNLTVHVYGFFEESSAFAAMRSKVESILHCHLDDKDIVEIVDVRDVAPKKHMLRMSFRMPWQVLVTDPDAADRKKMKLDP